jgi:uncharacterized membrane protein
MTDLQMDNIIGRLLRAGVMMAASVVLAGGVWYLIANRGARPDYLKFHAQTQSLHALSTLPLPEALILVGLLLLIATPVARVVFSLVAFTLERDRAYVVITGVVLVVLLYSIGTNWL